MKNISRASVLTFVVSIISIVVLLTVIFLRTPRPIAPSQNATASSLVGAMVPTVNTQTFSGDGYTLLVPTQWQIERITSSSIAVHDGSDCTLDLFQFPFSADEDRGSWISKHIAADPSLAVMEHSAEDVSISGGTGVKWTGTIDDASTTLVYAFGNTYAYEVSPTSHNDSSCADTLNTLTASLNLE